MAEKIGVYTVIVAAKLKFLNVSCCKGLFMNITIFSYEMA